MLRACDILSSDLQPSRRPLVSLYWTTCPAPSDTTTTSTTYLDYPLLESPVYYHDNASSVDFPLREDRFGDRRSSDGDYKLDSQSPERAKDLDSSSSPVVRPVRDILGENVVPLRISEPPKTNSVKAADGSALTQVKTIFHIVLSSRRWCCNLPL